MEIETLREVVKKKSSVVRMRRSRTGRAIETSPPRSPRLIVLPPPLPPAEEFVLVVVVDDDEVEES